MEMSNKKAFTDKWWISPHNFEEELIADYRFPEKVGIYDTTLRDGEQTPGVVFRKKDKIEIAAALDDLGVQRIEAGMPVVSPEDKEAVKDITKMGLNSQIWGFCRCLKTDVDECIDCGVDAVICEIATSDLKMKAYGLDKDKVVERMMDTITYAKDHGLYTAFFAVDMTRANLDFLRDVYTKAVNDAHADEVVAVDTLGVATPEAMNFLIAKIKEWVNVPIHVHCHNDFGLATAASISAVKAGAQWVHATVNGIGEKAGNTDIAEVALSLYLLYDLDVKLKYEKLSEISRIVQRLSKIELSPTKPVVGKNVFRRESGVAVLQLIRYPPAVESFVPELVGGKREIVLGKKSGRHAIEWRLKNLGISSTEEQIKQILRLVKNTSERKKRLVSNHEFKKIAEKVIKTPHKTVGN